MPDDAFVERHEQPDGTKALQAARRLSAMLETIRASASDWSLDQRLVEQLGTEGAGDPSVAALLAVALDHHARTCHTFAGEFEALADRVEAMIDAVRNG